jgi:hypothetical protein
VAFPHSGDDDPEWDCGEGDDPENGLSSFHGLPAAIYSERALSIHSVRISGRHSNPLEASRMFVSSATPGKQMEFVVEYTCACTRFAFLGFCSLARSRYFGRQEHVIYPLFAIVFQVMGESEINHRNGDSPLWFDLLRLVIRTEAIKDEVTLDLPLGRMMLAPDTSTKWETARLADQRSRNCTDARLADCAS